MDEPMHDSENEDEEIELLREELVTYPERLIAVMQAAEILHLGWTCEKECVELRGQDGEVAEVAIHFRFKLYNEIKTVPPDVFEDVD